MTSSKSPIPGKRGRVTSRKQPKLKVVYLYRHFNSKNDLLYVGISINVLRRLLQHKSSSNWFDIITYVTITRFNSHTEAIKAERKAIINENPKYNKAGKSPFALQQTVVTKKDRVISSLPLPKLPNKHKETLSYQPGKKCLTSFTVRSYTGLSRSTINRLERNNLFPKHFNLSSNTIAWYEDDINQWIESRTSYDSRPRPHRVDVDWEPLRESD